MLVVVSRWDASEDARARAREQTFVNTYVHKQMGAHIDVKR